jgi:hypothetical protein
VEVELTDGTHADCKFTVVYPYPNIHYSNLDNVIRLHIAEEGFRASVDKLMEDMEMDYELTIEHEHCVTEPTNDYLQVNGYHVTLKVKSDPVKCMIQNRDKNLREAFVSIKRLLS